ncbi:MAG: RidA family protein [Pseudomonadota bacterium]
MERQLITSGAPWESRVGYSRAVRVGPHVHVSGTTAVDAEGVVVGRGDPHAQTVQCLRIIEAALAEAGARLDQVVRTRMYIVELDHWQEVGRAHGEFFAEIRPASTLVQVAGLIAPELLVEIEVDAFIG